MNPNFGDGGAAFPTLGDSFMQTGDGTWHPKSDYGMQGAEGMSLRDYIAIKAMAALIAKIPLFDRHGDYGPKTPTSLDFHQVRRDVSQSAYDYADAMLEQRGVIHAEFPATKQGDE